MYLTTLGQPAIHRDGPHGPVVLGASKSLLIPTVLATAPEFRASRELIADLIWGGMEHRRARRALRQALHYLGSRAGEHLVEAIGSDLTLNVTRLTVDLHEFEDALQSADYARVVELYGGQFLSGLEGSGRRELDEWIEAQNEYVRTGLQVAYSRLVVRLLEAGAESEAVEHARAHAALNPLEEDAQLLLIRSLKAAGNLVGALQAYRSYRMLLAKSLGDRPSEDLERLAAAVREELVRQAPDLAIPPRRRRPTADTGRSLGRDPWETRGDYW